MQNKVKLTKRQIKEDKFATFMLTTKDQFMINWQLYVIGIAVVGLLITAGVYYLTTRTSANDEAGSKLATAILDYRQGNNQVAILGLTQVAENYSGDDAGEQATFLLGKISVESKNYPDAIRYYEEYLSKYKTDKLARAAALAGIAASNENQGNYSDAAGKFMSAVDEYPSGPLVADYNLGAMRCYLLQGDVDKARERLEVIKDKYSETSVYNVAMRMFAEKAGAQAKS